MAEEGGEADRQLLEENKVERERIEEEIKELRERNERRKKEREEEEKRLAAERAAEDARRKSEEEERKKKKEEEDVRRRNLRAQKMAEFEKWKTPQKANFVISKKVTESGEEIEVTEGEEGKESKKSKEQLEAEKRAILNQRIKPLEISNFDQHQLSDKAKELHTQLVRLEGEKYDLEKRFKTLQVEMMELAERARQANRVGKEGLKRVAGSEDDVDRIQTRFAGTPAKVEMYSKYERQKDKRSYGERKVLYTGPQYILPPERIKPTKIVGWNEEGMPMYSEAGADSGPPAAEPVAAE